MVRVLPDPPLAIDTCDTCAFWIVSTLKASIRSDVEVGLCSLTTWDVTSVWAHADWYGDGDVGVLGCTESGSVEAIGDVLDWVGP